MLKVRATNKSKELQICIIELGREAKEGEEFEIEEERANILMGNNKYNARFVELVSENKPKKKKKEQE